MTGYTVHTGSNEKFSHGWDNIFGGKKSKSSAGSTKKAAKKSANKQAAKKKAGKSKSGKKSKS